MNKTARRAAGTTLALVVTGLLLSLNAEAQLPADPVERAKVIAQIFQANASQLTIFDRKGTALGQVGSRDLHQRPTLSPDGKRIAVIKPDIDKETSDAWIVDAASGESIRLTTSQSREGAQGVVWSPDGSQVAYVALRGGYFGLYRQPSTGGAEELLYQNSAPMTVTEWSLDGRYLGYFSTDLSGGRLYALPLTTSGERKPIEVFSSEHQVQGIHFSPDSRYVSYVSNESGRNEIYVRRFTPDAAAPAGEAKQVSDQGAQGLAFWRRDGKELYYLAANRAIMAVPVTASATSLELGKPTLLFRASDATPLQPGNTNISHDGERVLVAVPPPQLRQLTVFDRQGKVVSRIGAPGLYQQPGFSPDGKHVVVMKNDLQTGNVDIWTLDIATGEGKAVTSDTPPENAPIWSPDGKQVAYVSTRGSYAGIYRKAADGTGEEELLFRYTPGAGMVLTDWSPDSKFMTFYTGVLVLVPISTAEDPLARKEIDWLREDYDVVQGRFSPDGRFLAYMSNEADPERMEVYFRAFDPDKPETPPPGSALQVSQGGAIGMVTWRQDAKEMFYITRDWEVMAVDITTTPTPQAGTPKMLFKLPGPLPGNPPQWKNVSRDGQRFVFAMPGASGPAR